MVQQASSPADPDQFSSVSLRVGNANSPTDECLAWRRRINNNNQETPNDWIEYRAGLLPPVSSKSSVRSAVSAEFVPYQGKSMEGFEWIDLFHALVLGEKLTVLKQYLKDECRDVVYG